MENSFFSFLRETCLSHFNLQNYKLFFKLPNDREIAPKRGNVTSCHRVIWYFNNRDFKGIPIFIYYIIYII